MVVHTFKSQHSGDKSRLDCFGLHKVFLPLKKYEYNYVKYTSIPNVKRHLNHITEPPCSTPYSIYSFQRNLEIMCTHFRLEIKRVFVGRS